MPPGVESGDRRRSRLPASVKVSRSWVRLNYFRPVHYRQDTVFNASTYLAFLEQLARRYRRQGAMLIQDNASYHKDGEVWKWFSQNRHWLEVHQLPRTRRS